MFMSGMLRSQQTREKMIEKVDKSVRANAGNPGFVKGMLKAGATTTRKHRCAAAYIVVVVSKRAMSKNMQLR